MADKDQFYRNFSNRKSYNDAPLREGEVLVPIATTYADARHFGMNLENLETWHFYGKKVLVAFAPVQEVAFDAAMKFFNQEVHHILNPHEDDTDDLSLDAMLEALEDEEHCSWDPTGTTENEDIYFLEMALRDLIQYYINHAQPEKGMIIQLLWDGYSKSDVAAKAVPNLKKSRAYEFIRQTQDEGYQLLNEKFRIK